MADKTILDFPEASSIAEDDYIMMAGPEGRVKIPAKYFNPSEPEDENEEV